MGTLNTAPSRYRFVSPSVLWRPCDNVVRQAFTVDVFSLRSSLDLASRPPHILRHHSILSFLCKLVFLNTPFHDTPWGMHDGNISSSEVPLWR